MPTNKGSPKNKATGAVVKKLSPEKSASFHGRLPTEHPRALRRPNTQPDLLTESRKRSTPGKETPPGGTGAFSGGRDTSQRVPTKVLVNVTVQRSLGAVQVLASTDWTVGELVISVLQQYAKEGRRPSLPSLEPSAFALHYSQFSLECLDAEERLIGLGSRNFFLCPKPKASESGSPDRDKTCAKEAATSEMKAKSKGGSDGEVMLPWLRFMDFLL